MTHFATKGHKTGLAFGCTLAALCILGMFGIIFFPHLIGFSLVAIAASKALLGCNAFCATLGLLIWQDPTIRRQSGIEWTSSSYPLLLGFIGYAIAHTVAFFGKWIGKGMDKLVRALNRQPIQPEKFQFNESTSVMLGRENILFKKTPFETAAAQPPQGERVEKQSDSKPAAHSNVFLPL